MNRLQDGPPGGAGVTDFRALGQLVGELYVAAKSARACGLSFDEVVTLLCIQYRGVEEMSACSCGARWTKFDLDANPNAPDEHECGVSR